MGDTDGRRGRAGGISAGSVAVALVAVLACVVAFLVTSRLLQEQGSRPLVRCWDGTRAAAPAGCHEPDASPAAFAWVFPDVDLDLCTTRGTPERTIVTCFLGEVETNLSRWAPTVRFGVSQQKAAVTYADTEAGAVRAQLASWMRPARELRAIG